MWRTRAQRHGRSCSTRSHPRLIRSALGWRRSERRTSSSTSTTRTGSRLNSSRRCKPRTVGPRARTRSSPTATASRANVRGSLAGPSFDRREGFIDSAVQAVTEADSTLAALQDSGFAGQGRRCGGALRDQRRTSAARRHATARSCARANARALASLSTDSVVAAAERVAGRRFLLCSRSLPGVLLGLLRLPTFEELALTVELRHRGLALAGRGQCLSSYS
jgi:hypothetical protein